MISKDIETRLTTFFLPNMAHSLENFCKISEFKIFFLINQQVYSISRVSSVTNHGGRGVKIL